MAKKTLERRCVRVALDTYLDSRGWNDLVFKEGFRNEETIDPPIIAVHFLPTKGKAFQLGNTAERLYSRVVQVDCYMENENRADSVIDDIMDFFDLSPVAIVDSGSTVLGSIICQDSESIYGEIFKPNLTSPKLLWWRGIVRATMEAHYF